MAVAVALLLLTLAGNVALDRRADRQAWRHAAPVPVDRAALIEATRTDVVRDRQITIVHLAPLEPDAPAPPGLRRAPDPGEVWLSPSLASLARELPAGQLADRFGDQAARAGSLGEAALAHPDELVAVVGHRPSDAAVTVRDDIDPRLRDENRQPRPIATFQGDGRLSETATGFRFVAAIATVLVLAGGAARLTVARRDRRLLVLTSSALALRRVIVAPLGVDRRRCSRGGGCSTIRGQAGGPSGRWS